MSPDILIFIDVDDLGFSFIKAIDISSEGVVNKVTAMHLELRGICNEKEDINCPGNPLTASWTGERLYQD